MNEVIPKALDLVESVAGSHNLDVIETTMNLKTLCFHLAAPIAVVSYLSPFPLATLSISSLGLWLTSRYDYVQAKKALVEKKIAQIVAESAGKPKRALIIQSPKDEFGALSMRTHVENVRKLAETYEITRVMISSEEEYLKMISLAPGRFDIVWVRAHGKPNWIEIGTEFKLTKSSRPEIYHKLAGKLKHQGKLILECCHVANAATAETSIAEHIASYCWDATVYAPLTKISGIFGLAFDKWGCPAFNDGFKFKGRAVTRVIEGPEPRYQSVPGYSYYPWCKEVANKWLWWSLTKITGSVVRIKNS